MHVQRFPWAVCPLAQTLAGGLGSRILDMVGDTPSEYTMLRETR